MTVILLVIVSLLTCAGQLLQKRAVISWQTKKYPLFTKLRNPWLITSFICLGIALLVWLKILQQVPVSIAYPILSLNFVFITLASRYYFAEKVDRQDWIGILCIMIGICLLGGSL